ncbi:MAG: 3'-5' exoribonuclease domain-containing protein [Sodalis sp. (in: enterobacteria)]|uniref:3'-5' exoribonuclease domain-containing protein n=1 Tax=Sodalis sp. (in: enterobacteria) TaxID=1898979 RepID=UPI0039E3E999
MLDIETLGKKAGCPILSVAVVMFEPVTGRVAQPRPAAARPPDRVALLWWPWRFSSPPANRKRLFPSAWSAA